MRQHRRALPLRVGAATVNGLVIISDGGSVMAAVRTLSIPASMAAMAALLAACGSTVTVERSAEVARPAATAYAFLATIPSNAPFGEGTITVTGASENVVRADLTVGELTVPVEFAIAAGQSGVTVTATATRDVGGNPLARFGGDPIAPVLEAGLASLKQETEALGNFDFGSLKFDVVDVTAKPFLFIEAETPNDAASIKLGVLQAMSIVDAQIQAMNLRPDGAPVAVETKWDDVNKKYAFQAGRPFTGTLPPFIIAVKSGQTPGGTAIRVIYEGPEDSVLPVYDQVETLIAAGRLQKHGGSFEVYLDDPTQPGGSVKREIYHVVTGDARRLETLFPNNRPAPLPAAAPTPTPAPTATAPATTQPAAAPAAPGAPAPIATPPATTTP